ncbi:hydroxyisourate hydrolase [Acerihabitans sp. KWT182]|uniref:5-hydroxyisourate hydrolase n=1 Tax=Acerihabitans sp. KWT182 TaxID=3157919 RepID=A0AAU7Q7B7_9GAMM
MGMITTHVLDTSLGKPAAGMAITLEARRDGAWVGLADGITGADGRLSGLTPDGVPPGHYRLSAGVREYFAAGGRSTLYGEAIVDFYLTEGDEHLHLPLLVSPYGWSTYRGS